MFKDKQRIMEILQITLGVFIVSIGFYFFFSPENLVTGGVSGSSIIFEKLANASKTAVSIFMFALNGVLLIVGGLALGKEFFYKTFYGTLLLPFLIFLYSLFIPDNFNILGSIDSTTSRYLIAAVTGAFCTGLGLGLVFKNNATTGGTDVLQQILHRKMKIPYSIALYLTDGIVILGGLLVFGIEPTFYAIFALSIAGFVIDKVMISGRSGYTVFIVTTDYHNLKDAIYSKINRGITKVPVIGGYSEIDKDMIICTITRNQLYQIKSIISDIDPNAFTIITKTSESVGQGFK